MFRKFNNSSNKNYYRNAKIKCNILVLALCVCLPVMLALGIVCVIYPVQVRIGGMHPTLQNGDLDSPSGKPDWILVSRISYLSRSPQRGDIVMFNTHGVDSDYLFKNAVYIRRIAGLPGETIQISPPYVLVNGEALTNPPIFARLSQGKDGFSGYKHAQLMIKDKNKASANQVWRLGKEEYFVLGDKSVSSVDSRHFGPLHETSIIGKVIYVLSPSYRRGFPDDLTRWRNNPKDSPENHLKKGGEMMPKNPAQSEQGAR